jgi:hypothetical protein
VTPSRDELQARLEALDAAPAPRAEFVSRLEARLQSIDPRLALPEPPPARRHRALPGLVALGVAAAAIAMVFTLLPEAGRDRRLGTTGNPPADAPASEAGPSTTVALSGTTTTLAGSPTASTVPSVSSPTSAPDRSGTPGAVVPSLPPGPGTTRPSPVTTTPRTERSTTTTRPPEPEALSLSCVAGQPEGQPGIQCDWSQSTAPAFASYRLWRATGTDAKQQINSIPVRTITRYIDRPPAGDLEHYQVEALDSQGRVIGRSPIVEATCC